MAMIIIMIKLLLLLLMMMMMMMIVMTLLLMMIAMMMMIMRRMRIIQLMIIIIIIFNMMLILVIIAIMIIFIKSSACGRNSATRLAVSLALTPECIHFFLYYESYNEKFVSLCDLSFSGSCTRGGKAYSQEATVRKDRRRSTLCELRQSESI